MSVGVYVGVEVRISSMWVSAGWRCCVVVAGDGTSVGEFGW